jgi:hypothetical protein
MAGYPFNTLIERVIDNYVQARGYMGRMEARLVKTGRLIEFNQQFQDNKDRGAFKALTRGETDNYKGPINYISMVEPFKTGPHATTPLRICMNSSMKQPAPSGVSLNDCLLKGPSTLADLYTVTLGMREHRVAFTKNISKFYQCVEADEAAQHVRRILCGFGKWGTEPTIFVTKRVNYWDKPVGYIAIAAVRETVEKFGEWRERAAWFLKNRTYVDDATGGAEGGHGSGKACLPGHGGHIGEWRIPVQGDRYDWGSPGKGWGAEEGVGAQVGYGRRRDLRGCEAEL